MTRRTVLPRLATMAMICVLATITTRPLAGQVVGNEGLDVPVAEQSLAQLLANVRHNIVMGTPDVAIRYINAVIERNPKAAELVDVVENTDLLKGENGLIAWLEKAARQGGKPEMNKAAKALLAFYNNRVAELRDDPKTITREIENLSSANPMVADRAVERLAKMAPDCVPLMVNVLLDDSKRKLHGRIVTVLPKLGRPAVEPLCEALDIAEAVDVKMILVQSLASLSLPHAMPYIQRLSESEKSDQLKAACKDALRTLARSPRAVYAGSAAKMFYQLGEAYYTDQPSLRSPVPGDKAPVWRYDASKGGVIKEDVASTAYCQYMTIRSLIRSLQLDRNQPDAISLWLAANFRKEARGGAAGAAAGQMDAQYYARMFGPKVLLRTLSRAVEETDAAVALGVIRAISDIGVPKSGQAGAGALALALTFPDPRVQAEAGLAHRPCATTRLASTDVAARVLGRALSQTGQRFAVALLPKGAEASKPLLDQIKAAGYGRVEVVTKRQAAFDLVRGEGVPTPDLLVFAWDGPEGGLTGLNALREDFRLRHVPTLAVAVAVDATQNATQDVPMLAVVGLEAQAGDIGDRVSALLAKLGIVPMTPDEAKVYAVRAAEVLALLADRPATAEDALLALDPLKRALGDARVEVAAAAGEALSYIAQDDVQRSLAAAALDTKADPARRAAQFSSLAGSIRRFGCKLTEDQCKSLGKTAREDGNADVRKAAAKAMGSADLTSEVGELILNPPKPPAPADPPAPANPAPPADPGT